MFEDEKTEGVNCVNKKCSFFDHTGIFEQNCSKGDNYDNSMLPECENYIPGDAISEDR